MSGFRLTVLALLLLAGGCLTLDPEIAVSDVPDRGLPDRRDECVATSSDNSCPPRAGAHEGACFDATQLGGHDFCADFCTTQSSRKAGAGEVCLASGAELTACKPSDPQCPAGLDCYRTDLLKDTGVCTSIPVCTESSDCPASRPKCGGEVLRELDESANLLWTDHLPCLQAPCDENTCDGRCLRESVTDPTLVPDICVPTCEEGHRCPPNFYCETASGPGYPPICIPGLPGYRCSSSDDCLLADCLPTGAGFSVCSTPCKDDQSCALLGSSRRPLVCARPVPTSDGVCVSPAPFEGEACALGAMHEDDCPVGKFCSWSSAVHGPLKVPTTQPFGECRAPCQVDGTCPAIAGLPHACLPDGAGCYPAELSVPCDSLGPGASCIGLLTCTEVAGLVPDDPVTSSICTLPCAPDAATGDPYGDRYCRVQARAADAFCADDGFCRRPRLNGQPCSRDEQCSSDLQCSLATMICIPASN